MLAKTQSLHFLDAQLREVLAYFPLEVLVILFASVASGQQRADSDLDSALSTDHPLAVDEKTAIFSLLAERTGRLIDLIDFCVVGESLLGQIVHRGRRVLGTYTLHGLMISKYLFEQAGFMPYQARISAERRPAWIGK